MTTNVAFFGAGEQARPYLDALARRSDVQLVGVCDPDRRAAEVVAAGWGAQVFTACEAMLADGCPDVLWVCVPPAQHGEVLLRAAGQRIPFFVDPPGALNHDQAQECGKRVREARLVSAVGFPTAYTDVAREAREYLGGNMLPLALGWWLKPARESPDPSAVRLLWNEACVMVDSLRYFAGEAKRVHAFPAGNAPAATAGGLVLHLEFVRGTTAVLTLATFPRPEPRVELELSGDGWSLAFNEGLSSLRVAEQDKTTILRCLNRPVEEQVNTFLEAVATGEPSSVPTAYADALATLTVCEAAIVSAVEGRAVEIASLH
jgi:myo-inositol 2-dehydrogenase/D-chiro-inositol 1-dehydrogenase